jgi:2-polyprenyl-6-methoxyphenol hydroxylase-like FAD-dependent oxidoreductase
MFSRADRVASRPMADEQTSAQGEERAERAARPRADVPVLVVGGSLVGLSASLFLARHGVEHLVVERHPGTAVHPRAAFVFQRTVEAYRGAGVEREVLEAARREFVQNGAIMSVESLGGRELQWYFRNINDGVQDLSPVPRIFVTQIGLEPVLRRAAADLGARLRYSCEVVSLEPDADGVTAVLRDRTDGTRSTVRARYVIAADGYHSPTRSRLGIPMCGHGSFSDSITIYFRADVRKLIGDRNLSVVYVFGPRLQGFFRFAIDGRSGFLVVNSSVDESGRRTTSVGPTATPERCVAFVREALGAPDLPVEIEDVQRWSAAAEWAERFRAGPILLAGDAVHVMPPTGGYGGNTGVHDARNLAWKLAYVLKGYAGPELLSTYEPERLPAARFTVEQAYARYVTRLDPGLGTEGLVPIVDDAVIDLGLRYRSPAVIAEDGDDGADHEDPHHPSGRPGFRGPHVPIRRNGTEMSTVDLPDRSLVLLAGPEGKPWLDAGTAAAARLGVPLDGYRNGPGGDLDDPGGDLVDRYGIGAEGATLIRPDGVVAWRARGPVTDPERVLGHAIATVLHRPPAA